MRLFFLALFFFLLHASSAQKVIISGATGNRPLVWSDFSGKPDNSSPFFAMTYWTLRYSSSDIRVVDDGVAIGSFNVVLELDPKYSWRKPDKCTDALLEHEQGHFYLGLLCMKELLADEKEKVFSKNNINGQMQSLFEGVMKKYRDLEKKYDDETDHSKNAEQQKKWNDFFKEQPGLL